MFTLSQTTFGSFEAFAFTHAPSGVKMLIVPDLGGSLQELVLCSPQNEIHSIIEGYPEDVTVDTVIDYGYRNLLLFPFVNRLDGGVYSWNGQEYTFPLNEPARGNALHGALYNKPLKIVDSIISESTATCKLEYNFEDSFAPYPFNVLFQITYSLSVMQGLSLKIEVLNGDSESVPVAFGWHPYFQLSNRKRSLLKLPKSSRYPVDERLLPSGQPIPFHDFDTPAAIISLFDTAFRLKDPNGRQEITITDIDANMNLTYWQHGGKNGCNFFQIYTPPDRESIAIEPMTAAVNAFKSHEGLITVEPQSHVQFDCGVFIS